MKAKNLPNIQHIWFDLDGTIAMRTSGYAQRHADVRYATYAEITGQPYTDALAEEYEALYQKHGSNSAVFHSLGLPADFWREQTEVSGLSSQYLPKIEVIKTLQALRTHVPISVFSNGSRAEVESILGAVHIPESWFQFVLTGDDVDERKPGLAGFKEIIRRSELAPQNILYVGDRFGTDILPAKKVGLTTCLAYEDSPEADLSISKLGELISVLGYEPAS